MSVAIKVTVVIPAYRRTEALRAAVLSVFDQDLPRDEYEVIVVDSSPESENAEMLAGLAKTAPCAMRWFRKKAEGPGPSRNLGAREARGSLIAFMDSDCLASPGWLRAGIAAFEPGTGIVQGRTLPDPSKQLGVLRHYIRVEQESAIYETANVFYRKTAFDRAGGFPADLTPNANTPMGGEDILAAWAVKRDGWNTCFAADAVVYHEVLSISVWKWIVIKQHFIWPSVLRACPELRQFMFRSYFLDRPQALLVLGVLATVLAFFTHGALLALWLPYAVFRMAEPSGTLHGVFRPLRLGYLLRDLASFCLLLAGSMRYRCLLL